MSRHRRPPEDTDGEKGFVSRWSRRKGQVKSDRSSPAKEEVQAETKDLDEHIGRVVVHPTNGNVVYVAAAGALYKHSPDRGVDKTSNVHAPSGKASFSHEQLMDNLNTLLDAIKRARPPATKGT